MSEFAKHTVDRDSERKKKDGDWMFCRYGKFFIPDRDDLIFNAMRKYGEWAQQEIDVLARFIHPGATVIDAGAYVGTHARAFSQIVGEEGKVIAFEPNPISYEYLLENANLAQYANITTYQIALGARPSHSDLSLVQPAQNLGGTKISEGGTDDSDIVVQVQCLDNFDFGRIGFIKADLEGMEFPMLLGAEKTISRDHPVIFLEVNNLQASIPVLDWANAKDYMIFGLISPAFHLDNFNGVAENIFGEAVECGLLLVHRTELAAKESALSAMNLPVIDSADSLALLFLHKPQYFHEAIEETLIAKSLGLDVPIPLVRQLVAEVAERDGQIASLNQSIAERDSQIKNLNQKVIERDTFISDKEGRIGSLEEIIKGKDSQISSLNQAVAERDDQIVALDASVKEKENHITTLEEIVREKDDHIISLHSSLNQTVAERDAQIISLNQGIAEREGQISSLNQAIAERDGQIAERDRQIAAILSSTSWRLTRPMRVAGDQLKRMRRWFRFSLRNVLFAPKRFDAEWYLKQNPDVATSGIDPYKHYILFGKKEGRRPAPDESLLHDNKSSLYHLLKNTPQIINQKGGIWRTCAAVLRVYRREGFAGIKFRIKQLQRGSNPNSAIMDEGFSSSDQIVSNESGIFSAISLEKRCDSIPMRVPERVESSKQLLRKLEELLLNDNFVISISHDNYVQSTGGVQIKISDEQVNHNSKGIGYLHLYPYTPKPTLVLQHELFYIGINCNGRDVGVSEGNELMTALKQFASQKKLVNVYIHHTMGFNIYLIYWILNEIGNNKARFWLHDNFSLCPSYYLLRNDAEYCGAPDMESNACFICLYGETRRKQQSAFLKLFEDNNIEVVSPSNYELIFWKDKFPYVAMLEKVLPHAKLIWGETISARLSSNDPIRIGFVGFPVYHKGWQTWLRLINRFSDGNRYQYFLFSSMSGTTGNYTSVNVTTTADKRFSMVEALKSHKIDIAFLWSLCPETFSFTLHESLASGCFILTNKNSGNIQDYIRQNPNRGLILNDELALYELFSGNDLLSLVRDYQKNGVPQGEIIFLSE